MMNSDEEDFNDIYGDDTKKVDESNSKKEEAKIDPIAQLDQLAALQALSSNLNKQTEEKNEDTTINNEKDNDHVEENSNNNAMPAGLPWEQLQQTMSQFQQPQQPQEPTGPVKADISKDNCKMFIGGLNWETTEDGLKNYFNKYGHVTELRIMRDATSGRSRGFGFLTFEEPSSVDEVVKTQHILDGKVIDPKRSIPREEKDKTGKIFVGGIGSDVRPKEFEDFFAQYGTIIDAQLMLDKDTGRSRGFGFITYDTPDAVDRVCANKYIEFKGKQIEIKRAEPRHGSQKSSNESSNDNQGASQGMANPMQSFNPMGAMNPMGGMNPMFNPQSMTDYYKQMQDYYQQMQQQTGIDYSQMYQQQMQQMAMMMGGFNMPGMPQMQMQMPQQPSDTQQSSDSNEDSNQSSDPNVQTIGGETSEEKSNDDSRYDSKEPEVHLPKGPRGPSFSRDRERGERNERGDRGGRRDRGDRGHRGSGYRGGSRGGYRGRGGFNRRNNNGGYHPYGRDRK